MRTSSPGRPQPILTPESGVASTTSAATPKAPSGETLTATERAGWIAATLGNDELIWLQWSAHVSQ